MGAMFSVVKTLVVPAVIAFLAYVLLTYIFFPIFQHYRNRYSHYLPLDTLSTQTTSLRQRIQDAVVHFFMPSTWRQRAGDSSSGLGSSRRSGLGSGLGFGGGGFGGILGRQRTIDHDVEFLSEDDDDDDDDDEPRHNTGHAGRPFVVGEDGEELGSVQHGGSRLSRPGQDAQAYNTSRLSRDLEQGFMDDSEDDEPPRRQR